MKKSRMAGLMTAFALAFTTIAPAGYMTGGALPVYAKGEGTVTVKDQSELDAALVNRTTKKIVIKSTAAKLTIKKGNYSSVKLVVASAATKIVNAGTFDRITVKKAVSFTEKAGGNSITSSDSKLKINLKKQAKNTDICIAKEKSVTDVTIAGEAAAVSVEKAGCKVSVNVDGALEEAKLNASSELTLKGAATNRTNVLVAAEGASFAGALPCDVTVTGKSVLTFEKGAEGSTVKPSASAEGTAVNNKTEGEVVIDDGSKKESIGAGSSFTVGDVVIHGNVSGNGTVTVSGNSSDNGKDSGSGDGTGNNSGSNSGNSTSSKSSGARFACNLLKWYLVDSTTDNFDITPDSQELQVVFYVKSKEGKAIIYDSIDVISSKESVATVSWDQKAGGKYYVLTVYPGSYAGVTDITIKASEYKGADEVSSEFKFTVTSKSINNNIYNVELGQSSVDLYNSPYSPTADVSVKAVNSVGETVDAVWDVNVSFKGQDTNDVGTGWTTKDGQDYLIIDALGAAAGTYRVEVTATGDLGNNTKEITKVINVKVTDALKSVCPDGWSVSGGEIDVKGDVAKDISATYKVETEDLYISDYKGSNLSSKARLAVYVSGKPLGYLSTGGVEGISAGWEIGAKALSKSGAFAGDWDKVNYDLLCVYVYNGANYYSNAKDDTLYLGQMQKSEYMAKDKMGSDTTIKAGGEISIFSRSDKQINEIYYYGADSSKNNIAAQGRYNVVIKYGNTFDSGKQLGNTAKLLVSYDLKMPSVEYNSSEQADCYVTSDVDMVRAEDGYSVSYCAGSGNTTVKYPDYIFGNDSLSKGDKIYAVKVDDVRGGKLNDAAENADPGWFSAYPGADDMKNKYSFDGGKNEDGVLIHFVLEKIVKITV